MENNKLEKTNDLRLKIDPCSWKCLSMLTFQRSGEMKSDCWSKARQTAAHAGMRSVQVDPALLRLHC